ncbi:MAG: hypothetical protein EZS28_036176 [Streblomastix strix]|uniref:Uncharacterized protein n=1 Tax=Streblomastix strix TaxID=222440 RepID=A0A5J4UCU9_9EUKA|nr:MAG: hypothetical protein EZS28_036176 [Streblomastix strix]
MRGYKATNDCLQRVREFYANRPFVVPSQRVEACNLDLLFEATDEFEDTLTTPRNSASRRLNPHTDLTSFMITLQCERNSNGALTFDGLETQNQNMSVKLRGAPIYQGDTDCYYNVDLMGLANGNSCVYDVHSTFDEVICQIEG